MKVINYNKNVPERALYWFGRDLVESGCIFFKSWKNVDVEKTLLSESYYYTQISRLKSYQIGTFLNQLRSVEAVGKDVHSLPCYLLLQ